MAEVLSEFSASRSGVGSLCGEHMCLASLEHHYIYCSLSACVKLHSPSLQEQRQRKTAEFQYARGEEKLRCRSS